MRKPSKTETFDTMKQAAPAMGVSVDFLRQAKAMGAAGFHGGRIRRAPLEKWIKEHSAEMEAALSKGSLRDQKLREEIRKLRMANDIKSGEFVSRAAVAAAFTRGKNKLQGFRVELETKWPAKLAGLPDVAAARAECRRVADRIYEVFGSMAEEFEVLDKPLAETDPAG